jgi:hypothetical protein
MGLFSREDKLTANDLKNILLWYERMNMEREDVTLSDNRTGIKIQAMLIYQEESYDEEGRFRRRRRD